MKLQELQTVLTFFCCYANIPSNHILTHPIIDNITAKGRISLHKLDLTNFFHFCKKRENYKFTTVVFNPSIISVLYLKYYRGGKLILGKSGKFSIVGVQEISNLECIRQDLDVLMKTFWKTGHQLYV